MSTRYAIEEARVRHELLSTRGAKLCGLVLGYHAPGKPVICQVITQGGIEGQRRHEQAVHGKVVH